MKKTVLWDGDLYTKKGLVYRFRVIHLFWVVTWLAVAFTAVNYRNESVRLKGLLRHHPFPAAFQEHFDFLTGASGLISSSKEYVFEISIRDESNPSAPQILAGPVLLDQGDYVVTAFVDEPLSIFGFAVSNGWESELHYTKLNLPKGAEISQGTNMIRTPETEVSSPGVSPYSRYENAIFYTYDASGTQIEIHIVRKRR